MPVAGQLAKAGRLLVVPDGALHALAFAALPDPKPARSTVGVNGLGFNAALEVECIAILKE